MAGNGIAPRFEPPYYAVIFTSSRTAGDNGYGAAADRMIELAATMPGFLGVESVRDATGTGITVSYWRDETAIRNWRENAEHTATRANGRAHWYEAFEVRIAKVERAYGFDRGMNNEEVST